VRTHNRRRWPLFALPAVLALLSVFVLHGAVAGVASFLAMLSFIGACIYALAGEKVNDGVGGIGGPFS
jgi:hypothetical protein